MSPTPFLPRVLVIADAISSRRFLYGLLHDFPLDIFWQVSIDDLVNFSHWSEPCIIILAMSDLNVSLQGYEAVKYDTDLCEICVIIIDVSAGYLPFPVINEICGASYENFAVDDIEKILRERMSLWGGSVVIDLPNHLKGQRTRTKGRKLLKTR